ncbi:MAG: hypothetical protein AB1726_07830 [Planctomycetota bacterium]
MSLDDYWQENKRFVVTVGGGLVAFLAGYLVIDGRYEGDITAAKGTITRSERELRADLYSESDLAAARAENEALRAAMTTLEGAVGFRPRAEFVLDPALGSFPNQYLRALTQVREDLLPRANRVNLAIDPGLGMPQLSPTRDEEIVRCLEALDVIETVATIAIEARVKRIEKIAIRLDPGLSSRNGLGDVERTKVSFELRGSSLALTRVLAATQRPRDGRVLFVDELETSPSRTKDDEVQMVLTLIIARLRPVAAPES